VSASAAKHASNHEVTELHLTIADWRALDRLQNGLPIDAEPFGIVANELNLTVEALLALVRNWLKTGILTRFGPLFDAERIGGAVRLCAMNVPQDRFEEIAERVNAHSEVAHNYERRHKLNMWFVLASDRPERLDDVTMLIEHETGLSVLGLPKLKEFFIGLKVTPPPGTGLPETPLPERVTGISEKSPALDETDRNLVAALQTGLPLVPRPYDVIAERAGLEPNAVVERIADMLKRGAIRRVAAVPNHFVLGWTKNAMTVWDVDEEAIDTLGTQIGHLPFVSHCYRRPRRLPDWPYSLFAMVHGRSRAEIDKKVAAITDICGEQLRASDRLYSTRIIKKTGLRISG
jgi:siroheme decarboxylase